MTKKKILITGGAGFIGASLVHRLVALKNSPHVILRKNTNTIRLKDVLKKISIHESDLANEKEVKKIVTEVKPDIVIHLASFGVYAYSSMDMNTITTMMQSNIIGTLNLFNACKNSSCELFINTGSCFEYGNSKKAFSEKSKLEPVNVYGMTKAATTLAANVFYTNYNFPIVTLRPFTTYGPMEDERRFISTTIRNCLTGKAPLLTKQVITRDYIYIDDVVDAYIKVCEAGNKLAGEIMNISTGKGNTLKKVADLIISQTRTKGVSPQIGAFPKRDGEVISLIGDPSKAKKELNWKAKISLEEGIAKTIHWIRSQRL